jgi:phage terminase small subunit
MRRQATRDIRAFAAEFGFTPAQRTRIQVPKKDQAENPFAKMISGK